MMLQSRSFTLTPSQVDALVSVLEATEIPVYQRKDEPGNWRQGQTAVTLGLNINHQFGCWPGRLTFDPAFAPLLRLVGQTVREMMGNGFHYTSVQVNKNFPGCLHVDASNVGPSVMLTVGVGLEGGELWVDGDVLDTKDRALVFDGNRPHYTLGYRGTRYSLVCFTTKKWPSAPVTTLRRLKLLGFSCDPDRLPTWHKTLRQEPRARRLEGARRKMVRQIFDDV
jgi:hypothetical protein